LIWSKWLFEKFAGLVGIGEAEDKDDWSDLLKWFMEASTGHHGLPAKQSNRALTDFYSGNDTYAPAVGFIHSGKPLSFNWLLFFIIGY